MELFETLDKFIQAVSDEIHALFSLGVLFFIGYADENCFNYSVISPNLFPSLRGDMYA